MGNHCSQILQRVKCIKRVQREIPMHFHGNGPKNRFLDSPSPNGPEHLRRVSASWVQARWPFSEIQSSERAERSTQ
jgi:hypothetical protein